MDGLRAQEQKRLRALKRSAKVKLQVTLSHNGQGPSFQQYDANQKETNHLLTDESVESIEKANMLRHVQATNKSMIQVGQELLRWLLRKQLT